MRWSTMHIPTLRDDPAEAGAPSHRLLLRAGYIRQLMAGHYSLLPLAVRVRLKVIGIIREELNRIGAQEILMPVMHPAELWQLSGRWQLMGDEMFRLKDRKGAQLALGMTHEEIVTSLAAELNSYRDLPQMWYQFQTKLRDEPRPKAGLMRTREFTMKDSYSFDLDTAGLDKSFDAHHAAYSRAFTRIGIPAIPVEASNGSMGGSGSTEFICPSPTGEDDIVYSPECGYAANMEAAVSALAPIDPATDAARSLDEPQRFDTPGVRTIEDLATGYDAPADRQVKTLVYVLDGRLTLVLLRGDHALEEQKLIDATRAVAVRPAEAGEIFAELGAHPGSLGAVGVTSLPVIADLALRGRSGMTTGANTDDVHLRGVDVDRDIEVSEWADLRAAEAGEPCARCGNPLTVLKGIEVGHIFKLGYKYTDAFEITVSGPDGKPVEAGHGLLRHRRGARDGRVHRGAPRREGHRLAGRGRAVRGGRHRRAAERRRRRRGGGARLPGAARRGRRRDHRRPSRPRGREVQRRRACRHPVPHHDRQARPGHEHRRAHRPRDGRDGLGAAR